MSDDMLLTLGTSEQCPVGTLPQIRHAGHLQLLHLRIFVYGWANIGNYRLLAVGTFNRYPSVVNSTLQLVHSASITSAAAQLRIWVGQYQ